ncbi:MAG TPA: chorismate mutase [Bacteroidota bacterium]|nr:chorismate mutase [Bacteroidota bacterium]
MLVDTKKSVSRVREEIDLTDQMIILLLSHRQELVREVGRWKKEHRLAIADPRREQRIMKSILQIAESAQLDPMFLKELYRTIFAYSRSVQTTV